MKAMIFAAGLGTRLRPMTNNMPKALIEFCGKPLLGIAIDNLVKYGFKDIIVNIHHFAEQVESFLKHYKTPATITISDEREKLLDTGGGLKKASWFFDDGEPFLVHNVDVVSEIDLNKLYDFHYCLDPLATLATAKRAASRVFLINKDGNIAGWHNNRSGETILARPGHHLYKSVSFCGIHIIDPKIFPLITETGTFSITDLYLRLAAKNKIASYNTEKYFWADLGTPASIRDAEIKFSSF